MMYLLICNLLELTKIYIDFQI